MREKSKAQVLISSITKVDIRNQGFFLPQCMWTQDTWIASAYLTFMNDMELHNIKANFSSSIREIDHIFVTDFVKDNFYSVGMDHICHMDII